MSNVKCRKQSSRRSDNSIANEKALRRSNDDLINLYRIDSPRMKLGVKNYTELVDLIVFCSYSFV